MAVNIALAAGSHTYTNSRTRLAFFALLLLLLLPFDLVLLDYFARFR